jgi:hypothetical protein
MNVPAWFWWATAALIVGMSAAVETRRPLVIGIGVAAFVIGLLVLVGRVVGGSIRYAKPRNDLLPPAGVFAILGFVALVLAVTLPTAFALQAADMRYPATLSSLVTAILLIVGGPMLTRYLFRVMRSHAAGGR